MNGSVLSGETFENILPYTSLGMCGAKDKLNASRAQCCCCITANTYHVIRFIITSALVLAVVYLHLHWEAHLQEMGECVYVHVFCFVAGSFQNSSLHAYNPLASPCLWCVRKVNVSPRSEHGRCRRAGCSSSR